jgi:hypothetical protein
MIIKGVSMKRNRAVIFLGLTLLWAFVALANVGESGLNSSAVLRLFAGGMAAGVTLALAIAAWRQPQ